MFDRIFVWTIALLVFVIPFFFLPLTSEFYFFNKSLLLYCYVGILLFLWAIKIAREGRVRLVHSPFNWPIFLFGLCYLISLIFVSENKVEAIIGRGGLILSLTLLYLVITNNLHSGRVPSATPGVTGTGSPGVICALITSASLLALLSIYQYLGIGSEFFNLPLFMQAKIWTPAGAPLALVTFLIPTFILSLVLALKNQESLLKTLLFLAAALQVLAIIIVGSLILPGGEFPLNLLPQRAGWQIAAATFGDSPLLGVGPENYLSAFTRFRPVYLNNLTNWTIRFIASSNEYFHLLTTVGILGLLVFLLLLFKVIKTITHRPLTILYSLLSIFLVQVFLPANFLLLFLQYLFLAFLVIELGETQYEGVEETQAQLVFLKKSPWFILIPVIVLFLGIFYFSIRAWQADYYFRQSILAAAANRGKETYDSQIKAINFNPYLDRYRLSYSQTNLALANSLAAKADLSDKDRQDVTQLVQQAIREAKSATALNRNKVINWENLAGLYRNLINFAQDADQWAIASYVQAIRLDPTNPLLRVNLGGLYYSLLNYDEAIRQFQIATELKSDYANGYYNLAAAYREKGEVQKAVANMEIVTNLVEIDSADYQKAKSELEELKKKLPKEEKPEAVVKPETLKEPEALPTPMMTPPIELPEEAEPEVTPEPLPTPSMTPTATPSP